MKELIPFESALVRYLAHLDVIVGYENIAEKLEGNHEEFAKIRNSGFGASDSAAMLGLSPFTTREQLLSDKVNNVNDASIGKKASVRKGRDLEDLIISKVEKALGIHIYKPAHMYSNLMTGQNVNFDGVAKDPSNQTPYIPVEIKVCTKFGRKYYNMGVGISCTNDDFEDRLSIDIYNDVMDRVKKGEDDSAAIPVYYVTQLQQQIQFLNAKYGILGVLDDDNWNIRLFVVQRNDKTIKELKDICTVCKNMLKK